MRFRKTSSAKISNIRRVWDWHNKTNVLQMSFITVLSATVSIIYNCTFAAKFKPDYTNNRILIPKSEGLVCKTMSIYSEIL